MNLYDLRDKNVRKTWALMSVFVALVIGVGWLFATYLQNVWILYGAAIFALLMNVSAFWFSDKLALASVRARSVSKQDAPELYRLVENLSIAAGIPTPRVYIIDDDAPNAFATGRDPKHAAVAVTRGLLEILDKQELEGVLAHELAHIKNRDTLVMTVAVVLVGFLSILTDIFLRSAGFLQSDDHRANALSALLLIFAIIAAPIAGHLLQLAVSRKREYLADASGALLTRYPEGLARALEKIATYAKPLRHANHATAHLFIANPFGKQKEHSLVEQLDLYFSTHPPIEKRVAALRGMHID